MPVEPASSDTTGPCCGQRGIYYLSPGGAQPEIFHQCGEGALARRLQSGMKARGFEVAVNGPRDSGLKLLAESMMQLVPQEVIELRLNTGMTVSIIVPLAIALRYCEIRAYCTSAWTGWMPTAITPAIVSPMTAISVI